VKGAACLLKHHGSFRVPTSKAKSMEKTSKRLEVSRQTDTAEARFWTKNMAFLPKTATRHSSKEQGQKLGASSNAPR